ncbi:MAG: hypothetical protein M1818_000325 [Claussenomyces sp. TS43310]|nr:MAG: hypothetical protein M1818_000325 [Claussenomyces sp. TS43310]
MVNPTMQADCPSHLSVRPPRGYKVPSPFSSAESIDRPWQPLRKDYTSHFIESDEDFVRSPHRDPFLASILVQHDFKLDEENGVAAAMEETSMKEGPMKATQRDRRNRVKDSIRSTFKSALVHTAVLLSACHNPHIARPQHRLRQKCEDRIHENGPRRKHTFLLMHERAGCALHGVPPSAGEAALSQRPG